MIRSMPFANASLQILAQLIRTGSETKEGRSRIMFAMLSLVALYLSSAASVKLFGSKDQKEQYKDLNPTDLGTFLYFPFITGNGLARVKVSPELAVIGTLTVMALNEQLFNIKYGAAGFVDAIANILPQQMQITEPARMFLSWLSPVIKVPFELIAGIKDYPHVRPIEGKGMEYLPASQRYNEYTSTIAKKVGAATGWSPLKIDFFLTGMFGRYTGFISGKPGIYNIQSAVLRDYYFTMGRRVTNFYDQYQKVAERKAMIKSLPAAERPAVIRDYAKYNRINELLKLYRKVDLKDEAKASVLRGRIIQELEAL